MALFDLDLDHDSLRAGIAYARPEAILAVHARETLLAGLSDDERARHARFRFESDRDIYLVAHALVRRMLARIAGAPPESFGFVAGEYGRPEIAAPQLAKALRFNLSTFESRRHRRGRGVSRVAAVETAHPCLPRAQLPCASGRVAY